MSMCYIDELYYNCGHLHDRLVIVDCDLNILERNQSHRTCGTSENIRMVPFMGPMFCARCMPAKALELRAKLEEEVGLLVKWRQAKESCTQEEIREYRRYLMQEVERYILRLFEPDQSMW